MTRARNQQVSLDDTPYYHCISRCVRRAYLCGDDPVSGENFDYRKVWLVERVKHLAAIFAIDVCAYAVMSNHYHLVLHVDRQQSGRWTQDEVIQRWTRLFSRNAASLEDVARNRANREARQDRRELVEQWRERLADISWFMRCLNEYVARRANREDDCSGRFWEGRFKSQALLDERALVTCMAYVDLNPIRAGICDLLEDSDFTSVQERLVSYARRVKSPSGRQKSLLRHYGRYFEAAREHRTSGARLAGFRMQGSQEASAIPVTQQEYFDVVYWSASQFHGRRQPLATTAAQSAESTLGRLGIDADAWQQSMNYFHRFFHQAAGSPQAMIAYQSRRASSNQVRFPDKWIRGLKPASRLFGTS